MKSVIQPFAAVCSLCLAAFLSWGQDSAEQPVVSLDFAKEKHEGPSSPVYPDFPLKNTAGSFGKKENAIVIPSSNDLKFKAGDAITLETWLKIGSIGSGHMPYLMGKGRHGNQEDQNFAMRLKSDDGGVRLGFLFSGEAVANDSAGEPARSWHRWWSESTLPDGDWHHVSIVYTFGEADSLRAYIDGQPTKGIWDLDGKTNRAPVSDDSDLVIGTGYQRSASQTFNGWLDEVKIHRVALSDETLRARFRHQPPPPAITREMLIPGKVLVQVSEKGLSDNRSWPFYPEVTESWPEEVFGFFEWPQKYVSTGVRDDRANPSHFRASGLVQLPKGKHRLLLRGRGATRLFIDGEKILDNPFPKPDTGGHGYLSEQDKYLDLGPDFRFAPPGNRESFTEFESFGGEHFVILETIIGGNGRRPEFGETVAAISPEGSENWELLSPGERRVAYTDEGWNAFEKERREWLQSENASRRAAKRAEHAAFWDLRRRAAGDWLKSTPEVPVPALPEGLPGLNEIDHFIGVKIASVAQEFGHAKAGGVNYFKEIQPILEKKCYDCHMGSKIKGGLRLDTLEAALQGGDSDGPAISPGNPEQSSLSWRIHPDAGDDIMPPKGDPLSETEVALIRRWIEEGANWPQFNVENFEPTSLSGDLIFLRRLALDTIGVPPSDTEIEAFLSLPEDQRRARAIDNYLADPRWADNWMGYWQDVLAENPNIINPTLNNTGPFRWWIYESLFDNKPLDLFVTELIRMEGSERFGGPLGFGTASGNDVPMAEKGIIVGSAFLGVEMKCARCHDAPAHQWLQKDLFNLAAMLQEKPVKLPLTSSVPMDKFHERARKPLIEVTLQPGTSVEPAWPFEGFVSKEAVTGLFQYPDRPRDQLAAFITAPANERFAQVMVNRLWQRYLGRGLVDNVNDWEKGSVSHPALLQWLGRELVRSGYDVKQVSRLIFSSHAYQRATDPSLEEASPLFIAPAPRRLMAEQIVDSLFSATGKPFRVEEVSLDIDSVRTFNNSITLGKPERAWMLASTSNERDRPSLSLPRIQAVASLMETFGWRGARQDSASSRDTAENVLQPAILANGTMGIWLTRLSDDHGATALCLEDQSVEKLVDRLFLRLLTRHPSEEEKQRFTDWLSEGYENRIIPQGDPQVEKKGKRKPERFVSWSNHLDSPANTLAQEKEAQARAGDPPTPFLRPEWRVKMEDAMWALLNSPEWIYTP